MKRTFFCLALSTLAAAGCQPGSSGGGSTADPSSVTVERLGEPIAGLTPEEQAAFERGRALFERRWAPSEGLGPHYNAVACSSCHSTPSVGGGAPLYRNFYIVGIGPLSHQIHHPDLTSVVVPSYGHGNHENANFQLTKGRFVIPQSFFGMEVTTAQRNSIPIFGVGLFEAVSDATLLALTDPDDADGDRISGRVNNDSNGIGRFGLKAQANNLELFTRGPLQNQMGITSDPLDGLGGTVGLAGPLQAGADPNDSTFDHDGVADPEITPEELSDLIAFQRFLAPPEPAPFTSAALRGESSFHRIGCTKCHVVELPSSRGPVRAYTDLLLHDMGNELADGIDMGRPQASSISSTSSFREFRTQPLWGVSHFPPYLHDGRAATLEEAILLHGGEARDITADYEALPRAERDEILTFLKHL